MNRDMDLVRSILTEAERSEESLYATRMCVNGISFSTVAFHVELEDYISNVN